MKLAESGGCGSDAPYSVVLHTGYDFATSLIVMAWFYIVVIAFVPGIRQPALKSMNTIKARHTSICFDLLRRKLAIYRSKFSVANNPSSTQQIQPYQTSYCLKKL